MSSKCHSCSLYSLCLSISVSLCLCLSPSLCLSFYVCGVELFIINFHVLLFLFFMHTVVDVFHEETFHGQESFWTRTVVDWTGLGQLKNFPSTLLLYFLCFASHRCCITFLVGTGSLHRCTTSFQKTNSFKLRNAMPCTN